MTTSAESRIAIAAFTRLTPACLAFLFLLIGCSTQPLPCVDNRQLRESGNIGDAPGMFREPRGISLTPHNTLLVTDFRNFRIQELQLDGTPINEWGRKGTGPGEFMDPTMAVMDRSGNLYAVDTWNHRVQKRDAETGIWQSDWAAKDFYAPRGIAIDTTNTIYVVNTSRHSIDVYRCDGKRLAVWGGGEADVTTFHDPIGIATDLNNHIYVADCGNARIKILNSKGEVVQLIHVADWDSGGFVEGYVDVDEEGKIYVTSSHSHKVIVYLPDGTLYSRFGKFGGGPELVNYPTGIAVTRTGQIVLADSMNHRIVTYAPPPPVPGLETQKEKRTKWLSWSRWGLDAIALIIVAFWFRRRRAERRARQPIVRPPGPITRWITRRTHDPIAVRWWIATAVLFIILGMTSLQLRIVPGAGTALLVMGTFLLMPAFHRFPDPPPPIIPQMRSIRRTTVILVLILLLTALFFRVHRIDEIPTGINNDAAWNGLYAYRILDGEPYTPFTSEAWGKSTLYFYMIAAGFALFGAGPSTLYLPCILVGILTVLCLFFLGRLLWNESIGFSAAFLTAVMAWHVTFSRTGYRAILAPLCLIGTGWFFYRALDSRCFRDRLLFFTAAGLTIGTGLHTYFPFRGIPIMMIVIGLHAWITGHRVMRTNWWGFLVLLASAFIVFLPLLLYSMKDPDSFLGRSSFLFIGNRITAAGSLKPLWLNIIENLQILHYSADVGNFFDAAFPIVSAPLAFFFTIGFAFCVRHATKRTGTWILATLFFGLLPGLLSEADAARNILVIVPITLCAGLGLNLTVSALSRLSSRKPPPFHIPLILTTALIVLTGAAEYRLYFHKLASSNDAQFGYARIHTLVGQTAVALASEYHVYVCNSHFIDTPKFLCHSIPGDVFAITEGREVDFITDDEILANLQAIKATPHSPDKGIAFVLDHCEKNLLVIRMIHTMWPEVRKTPYRSADPNLPPEYYVMTTPPPTGSPSP
ncbi:glycosyltransferase family 39 protein [bacterium]|nr:glycosyltransferase family 39 protein [candidate division CSSED10-310 bacterium]